MKWSKASAMFSLVFLLSSCATNKGIQASDDKFMVDKELFSYQSHFLNLDNGTRIHYLDEGKGPILLLLHGNPTWSFLYRNIIEELKTDFRLIVPDYPGFGLSKAPQDYSFTAREHAEVISEFITKLGITDFSIMMQDWGGPIGFYIAEKHTKKVNGLIIGNTWTWPLERTGHKVFSTLMGGWPGQFGAWCCNAIVHFFMTQGVEKKLTENEMAMYLAPFENRSDRKATHVFPAQLWDSTPFLEQVYSEINSLNHLPALIVWGQKDFAFQEPERSRFEQLFPNHQTVLLENAGHFIQEDAPEEVSESIRQWYKKEQKNH